MTTTLKWAELLPYLQQEATVQGKSLGEVLAKQGVSDLEAPLQTSLAGVSDPELTKVMLAKAIVAGDAGQVTRSSSTVSAKSIPQAAQDAVMTDAAKAAKLREEAQPFLAAMIGGIEKNAADKVAAISDQAAAMAQTRIVDADISAKEIAKKNSVLDMFGINSAGQNQILAENTALVAASVNKMAALTPAIQEAQSANPLTNVLGWLGGQVKLMELVPQYNAAARVHTQASKAIAAQQQLAQQQAALEPALTVDEIYKKAALAQKIDWARAHMEESKARGEEYSTMLTAVQVREGFANKDFQQSALVANLLTEHISRTEKQLNDAAEAAKLGGVNMMNTLMGTREFTPFDWQNKDKKSKDFLVDNIPTEGRFKSFGHAIAVANELGAQSNMAAKGRNAEALWLENSEKLAETKFGPTLALEKGMSPQEKQIRAVNDLALEWKKEAAKRDYTKLSKENPYNFDTNIAAKAPTLQTNPIAQYVQEQKKLIGRDVPLDEVMQYGMARVRTSGANAEQALQELHQFVVQGYGFKFESLNLPRYGFKPANPGSEQVEFPVSKNWMRPTIARWASSADGDNKPINLLNYAEFKNLIVRNVAGSSQLLSPGVAPDGQAKEVDRMKQDLDARARLLFGPDVPPQQ